MKKRNRIFLYGSLIALSSCLKAYVAPVETPTVPSKIEEVAGSFKPGPMSWELGVLDSVDYKGISDSSGFTIINLVNDSVLISIDTKAYLSTKRFKMPYSSRTENSHSTVFNFAAVITNPAYFVYAENYKLKVELFHAEVPDSVSYAELSTNIVKGLTSKSIYFEKISLKAPKK